MLWIFILKSCYNQRENQNANEKHEKESAKVEHYLVKHIYHWREVVKNVQESKGSNREEANY